MEPPEIDKLAELIIERAVMAYLEIGSGFGGSAVIVNDAMADSDGLMTCVDDRPEQIPAELRAILEGRARFVGMTSPAALDGLGQTGAAFDFVLVDGDHSHQGVINDVEGLLRNNLLVDGAAILFHDTHYHQVASALEHLLATYPALTDEGWETSGYTVDAANGDHWGGLRLLRFQL